MTKKTAVLGLAVTALMGTLFAAEGPVPKGVPRLDHVFVIMMENHGYSQIINNPNAPFINQYAKSANLAKNYFAVAHPSLTNYLEVVGASNFGVHSDNNPDWHNANCTTNLASGVPNTDTPASGLVCPIWERGATRRPLQSTQRTKHKALPETSTSTVQFRLRPSPQRAERPSRIS